MNGEGVPSSIEQLNEASKATVKEKYLFFGNTIMTYMGFEVGTSVPEWHTYLLKNISYQSIEKHILPRDKLTNDITPIRLTVELLNNLFESFYWDIFSNWSYILEL